MPLKGICALTASELPLRVMLFVGAGQSMPRPPSQDLGGGAFPPPFSGDRRDAFLCFPHARVPKFPGCSLLAPVACPILTGFLEGWVRTSNLAKG